MWLFKLRLRRRAVRESGISAADHCEQAAVRADRPDLMMLRVGDIRDACRHDGDRRRLFEDIVRSLGRQNRRHSYEWRIWKDGEGKRSDSRAARGESRSSTRRVSRNYSFEGRGSARDDRRRDDAAAAPRERERRAVEIRPDHDDACPTRRRGGNELGGKECRRDQNRQYKENAGGPKHGLSCFAKEWRAADDRYPSCARKG